MHFKAEVETYHADTGVTENEDDLVLSVAASNLIAFACAQKENYEPADYHYLIAHELTKLITGETKRLIIMSPPQTGKSEIATQLFPSFFLGNFPEQSIMIGAYNQDKANDFGRAIKGYMQSEVYQAIFPNTKISSDTRAIEHFSTTRGGHCYVVGIGAGATGRGANGLLLDDPYKNMEEADSETRTNTIIEWYKSSFRSRLRGDGWICIIQTRWNKRDVIEYVTQIDNEDKKYDWKIVKLVALIEDEKDKEEDPLHRGIGEALWPAVAPPEIMLQTKKEAGSRIWNALYKQNPTETRGTIFLKEWWGYWCEDYCKALHEHHYLPREFDEVMQAWDCSFKDLDTSDYVVGFAGGRKGANLYVFDRAKDRANVVKTCNMIEDFTNRLHRFAKIWRIGVEDKANGPAVISTMRQRVVGVIEIPANGSKGSRWNAAAPAVQSGNVFLPYGAKWVDDFKEETAGVPHGKYDDDADAISHLILNTLGARLTGILDWMRELVKQHGK